ncbi:MAG: DUF177 domain-containing protein [Clostridia bacterium]|nr:DUF177 domain-containing protein [Clostridia bacterium]
MEVLLRDLFDGTKRFIDFDYTTDLSEEEVFFEKPFKDPVRFSGRIENRAGVVSLTADIEAALSLHCSRCGKPIRDFKAVPVDMILVPQGDPSADEAECVFEVRDRQELNELLVPELLLDMDMAVLCKEDCRGRCFKCGADLNEKECGCVREEPRSPFSVLKNIQIK